MKKSTRPAAATAKDTARPPEAATPANTVFDTFGALEVTASRLHARLKFLELLKVAADWPFDDQFAGNELDADIAAIRDAALAAALKDAVVLQEQIPGILKAMRGAE